MSEEVPEIQSLDDLITREDVCHLFGVVPNTVDTWRFRNEPLLPYVRIGRTVFFAKNQIVWWVNQMQKSDSYYDTRY